MRKLVLILSIALFCSGAAEKPNGYSVAAFDGVILFVNATPTEAYTVIGKAKYKNSKKNEKRTIGDVSGMSKVCIAMEDALEKVTKGKLDTFDAAIVHSPIKIELINFDTISTSIRQCIVGTKGYKKKCGTKEIFFTTEPIKEYDIVKVIEVKNFTNLGQLKYGKNSIDNFLNKLYERSCKEAKAGVDFDAILLNDPDLILKRGFISTRTIDLIKYK